jgi:hypothetical protein
MRRWRPPVWWAALAAAGYPRVVLTPDEDGVETRVVIEGERAWRQLACFAPPDLWFEVAFRVLDDTPALRAEYDEWQARSTFRVARRTPRDRPGKTAQ